MNNCINLCEIDVENLAKTPTIADQIQDYIKGTHRIYIGSYFCSRFFLSTDYSKLVEFARISKCNVTLVLPVFTEKDLQKAKKYIYTILEKYKGVIDEITVNDLGMLFYVIRNIPIKVNLGRMFYKEPRDVRIPEYYNQDGTLNSLIPLNEIVDLTSLNTIEIDEIKLKIRSESIQTVDIAVHTPFCFMTTGNICKFASINKDIEHKFRPNCLCQKECASIYEHYSELYNGSQIDIFRIGRTVYYLNLKRSKIENLKRNIYFPFLEIIKLMGEDNEYTCSFE